MRSAYLKFFSLVALLRHARIPKEYRYYIRDNYYSNFRQRRYFFKDFLFKAPYKTIEYHGEFQQELTYVIPFAYWHYLNGTLKKTISCKNTRELYFFSSNHEEKHAARISRFDYENFDIPNKTHSISKDFHKWTQIPFKKYYTNNIYRYSKPILVIANKFNTEWEQSPINYFNIPMLDQIIGSTKKKYQVIYNRPLPAQIVVDNSEILNLNEHQWLRQDHPEVIIMSDLYEKHKHSVSNFNHLQLLVYSNCDRFISVHGGTAALASYFGGINLILSDPRWSMENRFNEFTNFFPKLSNAKILHAKNRNDVIAYIKQYF